MFHLLVMMMAIVGQSLIIDPTNTTCFVNAQYVEEDVDTLASTLNVITLSPFSQTFIEIDLRHMQEIPTL